MRLKGLVQIALIVFSTSVGLILFVGLVLVPPGERVAGLGLVGGAGLPVQNGSSPAASAGDGSTTVAGQSTPATGASATPASVGSSSKTATPTPAPVGTTKTPTPTPGGAGGGSTPAPTHTSTPTPAPTKTPAPTLTPAPTPPPVSCGQAGGTCTAAQVATHNAKTNCWVIYSGWYYVVTSYVNAHPGGTSVFNSATCGHDISSYMNGSASTGGRQHSHSGSAYTILNSYKVGQVQG